MEGQHQGRLRLPFSRAPRLGNVVSCDTEPPVCSVGRQRDQWGRQGKPSRVHLEARATRPHRVQGLQRLPATLFRLRKYQRLVLDLDGRVIVYATRWRLYLVCRRVRADQRLRRSPSEKPKPQTHTRLDSLLELDGTQCRVLLTMNTDKKMLIAGGTFLKNFYAVFDG